MKLLWSTRSPFVRKVMVAAHELGVADRIETERVVVDPANPNPEVMRVNPLGRIPTLILPDGEVLYDSRVIIEFLDQSFGPRLLPPEPLKCRRALTLQALADGLMEADLRWLEEKRRPGGERRAAIVEGVRLKFASGLDALEQAVPDGVNVGTIALGAALAHLDFRFAEEPWRPGRPQLAAWFAEFSARPSMRATEFADNY